VRPILAQHCYTCHGPDDGKRKGDLRLDRKADAFAARDGGAAFVAGDAGASVAVARIESVDDEERMPPPQHGDALKPAEVATLRAWLAGGATWQEHWAFQPPMRPAVPTPRDAAWAKNDVDRFVLARLEREGKAPSAEASREAWLRRVTFDLIGLPPTLAELDAFAADTSAAAHEKVVDRLLADPRYGERQASEWLDAARYADSSGYQRDTARQAWKWRDWVIDALNANMPFDRFTIEQLAGDLLPDATLAQRIATGFNRNHPVNTEAGEELDEYRSAYVIDRVHTTATTFLGLSVACAQCHDHKYDPISQREFYGFYDFFNHVKEKDNGFGRNPKPAIPAPGPDDVPRIADLERRIKTLEKRLDRDDPLADEAQAAWEQATRERIGADFAWTTLAPTELMAKHGSRLVRQDDGSILATGPTPARDTYELVFAPGKRRIEALRLEVLPDPSLPHGASGRADDGRFILSGIEVRVASVADSNDPPRITFAAAQADVEQERDEDEHYLTAIEPGTFASAITSGDAGDSGPPRFRGRGWSVAGDERKEARQALLVPIEPIVANETSVLRVTLTHDSANKFKSLIGRFRLSSTDDARVRTLLVPLQASHWRALGPFPASDAGAAHATEFAVEKDLATAAWKKKYEQPVAPASEEQGKAKQPATTAKPAEAEKKTKPPSLLELFAMAGKKADQALAAKEPALPAVGDANASDTTADAANDDAKAAAKKPKAKRLEWTEKRDWRDGERARLGVEGAASAWYVARKITCETPRTMAIALDGGVGAKVWLNGTLVGDFAPATEAPPAANANANPKEAKPPAMEFDEEAFFAGPVRAEREPRQLRIGLRAGENHLVVKLTGKGAAKPAAKDAPPPAAAGDDDAGAPPFAKMENAPAATGLAFICSPQAEGDDLLAFDVLETLRTTAADASLAATPVEASLAAALAPADAEVAKPKTPAERRQRALRRWYRTRIDVAGRALFEELQRLEGEKARVESKLPSALVMEELKQPRETHVFVRGDYRKKGDKVTATTPAALPPMAAELPRNRLGLARWLVAKDQPLTARVTVNRYWQQFFGLGLVRTADDFGIRGAPPSHPELLDWLATEFVQSGWNVKQLHRLLVLSATYRQTGNAPRDAWAADPDNMLLARGPRLRLTAEMVRDQALATSGLLVQKVGGESVKPFQPNGLWKAMLGSGDWKADAPEKAHRRGLYVYWKRGVPYPSFTIFDASKRETCTVTRTKTTTPLQALVTLNDPVQVDAARALGARLLAEGGADDEARLRFGFRLVTSRAVEPTELAILKSLLADQRTHFGKHDDAAKKLLGIAAPKGTKAKPQAKGEAAATTAADVPPGKPELSPAERAAWTQVGATLLNLEAAIRRG
jgi:hypothetical protein